MTGPYFCPELHGVLLNQPVLHCADNKAANSGVVGSFSPLPDSARIISVLSLQFAALGISPWIEFVNSAANLADLPSRNEFAQLRRLDGIPFHFISPISMIGG